MKQYTEDSHVPITFLILVIILFALFGCTTPSITIYQRGESIGNGKIQLTEMRKLNPKVTTYEGKADSGRKVIVKRKLK